MWAIAPACLARVITAVDSVRKAHSTKGLHCLVKEDAMNLTKDVLP